MGETLDDLPTRAYLLEVGQECCYRELADQQLVSKQCLEPIVQQLYILSFAPGGTEFEVQDTSGRLKSPPIQKWVFGCEVIISRVISSNESK